MGGDGLETGDAGIDDSWAASEGVLDGKPMLVRVRQRVRSIAGRSRFPHRLRVVWEYQPDNESGMPSPADLEAITNCENLLADALEQGNHAILTHAVMCDGLRQWIFYSSDLQESARRINDILPHDPPYPIELTVEPDADWLEYQETLKRLGL